MGQLFGTDGVRGEAGLFPLDPATIRIMGQSLATHLAESTGARAPRVVIGRDTRESGAWIQRAFALGFVEAGGECVSAGVITTPGVAYLVRTLPADAGVVISASHNPFHDNGIKLFAPNGRKLDAETEEMIESDIDAAVSEAASTFSEIGAREIPVDSDPALVDSYVKYLVREIAAGLDLAGMRVVIDCAHGAAFEIAPRVFRELGADVVAINIDPDGRNINLNCGSLHLEGLQECVSLEGANIGIGFDGDADRALFVDERGSIVDGDATLWMLASDLKSRSELRGDQVIATVMSNLGLELALGRIGVELVRTAVGDKYVLDELLRTGSSVGGEQSGHIIFPKLSLAGDGIVTSLKVIDVMRRTDKPLSKLRDGFEQLPQVLLNVRVRERVPFDDLPATLRVANEVERKLGNRGRLLLRYSGTEPKARVMIEGADQNEIHALASEIVDAIRSEIGGA